jgi:Arc/MetJ family transcription regulator
MKTTIDIDDRLLRKAMRLSGHRTKKATVEAALQLLVEMYGQESIRELKGKVLWEGKLES